MAVSINKTTRSFLQADTMTSLKLKTLLATLALAASGVASAQDQLLNVSYDVAREFYKDYNQAFAPTTRRPRARTSRWTSRMAAPAPRRAPNDGLAADVVTFNTTTDVDFLAANGVVAKDWAKKFPQRRIAHHLDHAVPGAQRQPQEHQGLVRPDPPRREGGGGQPQDRRQWPLRLSGRLGLGA
jgi:ABC-type sulfate transport system substrate-binding protein